MSWGLFSCLYKFKIVAEATEEKKRNKNLYILKQIEILNDYNGEGLFNYTYGERIKPYNTKQMHETPEKIEKPLKNKKKLFKYNDRHKYRKSSWVILSFASTRDN